jgi:hypothetical protein
MKGQKITLTLKKRDIPRIQDVISPMISVSTGYIYTFSSSYLSGIQYGLYKTKSKSSCSFEYDHMVIQTTFTVFMLMVFVICIHP